MNVLFIALGVMVLALLGLLLWFVPHLLQQQAVRVAGETSQLREMLLDLLNEQEAVTLRQTQLGSSLARLQKQIEHVAVDTRSSSADQATLVEVQHVDRRLRELQAQMQQWADVRAHDLHRHNARDNESWAHLLSLLATVQERIGALSREHVHGRVPAQAVELITALEQEMHNLRILSDDIVSLHTRVKRSLDKSEHGLTSLRINTNGNSS